MRGWRGLLAVALSVGALVVGTLPASAAGATVMAASNAKLGTILTNSSGMTLYWHATDPANGSACTGACATYWPPLTVTGTPTAGTGVTGKLTTFKNPEGQMQVAYNGHALYTFVADKAAGDTVGNLKNGFGGLWYAATVDVAMAGSAPAATAGTASTSTASTSTASASTHLPKTGTSPWTCVGGGLLILGGLGLLIRRRARVG